MMQGSIPLVVEFFKWLVESEQENSEQQYYKIADLYRLSTRFCGSSGIDKKITKRNYTRMIEEPSYKYKKIRKRWQ